MQLLSINIVKDGGGAQRLNLQPHDLIYRINGEYSFDPEHLVSAIKSGNVALSIIRDHELFEVTVEESSLGAVLGHVEFDEAAFLLERQAQTILLATTPTLPEKTIRQTIGLVSAQCIDGTGIGADIAAGIRDVIGGRAAGLEEHLAKARENTCREIRTKTQTMGGNAVVGLDFTHTEIGTKNGFILMVVATGTAVITD